MVKLHGLVGEPHVVLFAFDTQGLASLSDLVVVVKELNTLFEADGDQQADGDGGDMSEKVVPRVRGSVGAVDVEHSYCVFLSSE
jgi:hypothetical protein